MAALSIATSVATLALKFGASAMTGSIGLLSDALEALVNLAAGLVALAVLTVAERPADEDHAYGHEKAEYFSAGVEGVLILLAAGGIAWAALGRLAHPAPLERLGPGLVVAALAALMNFVTARLMLKVAREHDSIVVEADARHLLTDVLTSAGVIAGLLIVLAAPSLAVLDSLIALGVAAQVLVTAVSLLHRAVDGLMDRSLPPAELEDARRVIAAALPEGASIEGLRTRKSGARRFIEFKLLVEGHLSVAEAHARCDRIESALAARLAKAVVTIHVEPLPPAAPGGR
ncbi:MAG: cation transporter [Proteobacteria bacterium]|nr:cation transporter [Pseudomonadota bacterium]